MIKKLTIASILIVLFLGILYLTKRKEIFFSGDNANTITEKQFQNKIKQSDTATQKAGTYTREPDEVPKNNQPKVSDEELEKRLNEVKLKTVESTLRSVVTDEMVIEETDKVFNAFRASEASISDKQDSANINNKIYQMGIYDELVSNSVYFSGTECREAICKLDFNINTEGANSDIGSRMPVMFLIDQKLKSIPRLESKQLVIKNNLESGTMELYFY